MQTQHSRLGRVIVRVRGRRADGAQRRDVDDLAVAVGLHVGHDFFAAEEDGLEVQVDYAVPGFLAEDAQVGRLAVRADDGAGVVHQDVELAEGRDRGRDHLLHLGGVW